MVEIRRAEPGDERAIAELLIELDQFYGAADPGSADERLPGITDALFGQTPAAAALLALDDDE